MCFNVKSFIQNQIDLNITNFSAQREIYTKECSWFDLWKYKWFQFFKSIDVVLFVNKTSIYEEERV